MFQQQNLLHELGANAVECHQLSHLLQQAYQGRYDALTLKQALNKHQESLSNPLKHKGRDDPSMQEIVNNRNNYQLDMYRKMQLTDQDLTLISKFSKTTNLNQKYIVSYLHDAKVQIESEKQQQQQLSFLSYQSPQTNDMPKIKKFIKNAYFNARKLRLRVLRELIVVYDRITPNKKEENKMDQDEELIYSDELRKIISNCVQNIFAKNFISNICQSIQDTLRLIGRSSNGNIYREEYHIEICDCISIFYAISQRVQCNVDDIKSLLGLFEFIVLNKEFERSPRLNASSYLLSLSIYQSLDASGHAPYINPRDNSKIAKNEILKPENGELHTALNRLQNCMATINKVHDTQRYCGSFMLLIIALVYQIGAKVQQITATQAVNNCKIAFRHGAMQGLYKGFLQNETLLDEFGEIKSTIFVTLADFFCELFELFEQETREYCQKEVNQQQQRQQQQHYGSRHTQQHRKQRGLTRILQVLEYLAHHSQPFCNMFIRNEKCKSFIEEFVDSRSDLPTSWFPLYASFICELARDEPVIVYNQLIKDKCDKLSIDNIWAILEKTASIYVAKKIERPIQNFMNENLNTSNNAYQSLNFMQQQQNSFLNTSQTEIVWEQPPEMLDTEIRIVCSVLKVLESLGCIQDVQQTLDFAHRSPGIIALLFRLLQCAVGTEIRAHVISCISAFIHNSSPQADRVWEMVESNQILYTQRQTHQPITKGVELDLIEGEKDEADATYPVTVAFCELLKELLITTGIPQSLGQGARGTRPPGLHPYTDYIRDFVFTRWAKRKYKSEKEEWELAATCLEIFDALLNKFNPSDLKPSENMRILFKKQPSFELLTLLLAPHSNLVEVILDIYQKAFNAHDVQSQYDDDTMGFVKSALRGSLNLISKAIEKEEAFLNICQRYWPQKLSLKPLNITLLSQQYREQVISFAKCIEYGNDIHVASYSLSILAHLNKAQQGITLRSVFADQIFILQNSFSTQLFNPPIYTPSDQQLPDIRVSIVEFLLKSIKAAGHNLGLMLLAFSEQSASRDQLQSDISCLNAILKISLESDFCRDASALAEGCFELLYRLLSNGRIGERFLNAAENVCSSFFVTLLRQNISCTSQLPEQDNVDQRHIMTSYLNQRAWLLKSISFQFHLASSFNKPILSAADIQYLGFIADADLDENEFAVWKIFEQLDINIGPDDQIDNVQSVWGVNMDQFKQYANQQKDGTFTWNIPKMYQILSRAPQSMAVRDKPGQLQRISQEALNHNSRVSLMSALDRAYEAWAELIRCILGNKYIPYNTINNQLLLRLLDCILVRLSNSVYGATWGRVSNIISQVALNIMFFFRQSLNGQQDPVQITIIGCRTILEGMVNAILMQKDVRNPRANLYSCLSNYLHYCKFKIPNVLSDLDESKAINLNEKIASEKDKLNVNNVATLLARKEELLSICFNDCVSKDAYLSSISSLVIQDLLCSNDNVSLEEANLTPPQIWLSMLLEKSRLLYILKATSDLDQDIQRALQSQRHWYFLYQFESMMDILISASIYRQGTSELIDNNCISQYLSQLKCLTSRVFWTAYSSSQQNTNQTTLNPDNNNLSMECSRYLQLLTPCLRLINSMFISCPKNIRLHYQTLTFFQKHSDIINKLLTLENNEFVVLRCVKLILSIWYQLYYGPLYIRDPNRISTISARDSTILEHIESKLPIFYFLIKKFKDIAFKQEYFGTDIDNDFDILNNTAMYNENINSHQTKGETKEILSREIIRILFNIFRLKSIGSSIMSSVNNNTFNPVFTKDLNANNRINDEAPNLQLLCQCLISILPISKQTCKWINQQNQELRRIPNNNNADILSKLHSIEPMLLRVSQDVNLQCFLIENILLLLYFHCERYLKESPDFYVKFKSVVISEVIIRLKEWYDNDNECILHIRPDMIEEKWSSSISSEAAILSIPKSSVLFIEIMIEKFFILEREGNKGQLSLEYQ